MGIRPAILIMPGIFPHSHVSSLSLALFGGTVGINFNVGSPLGMASLEMF